MAKNGGTIPINVDRSKHLVKGVALLGPDVMGIEPKCFEGFMSSEEAWLRLSVDGVAQDEIPLKQLPMLTQQSKEPKWFPIRPLPYAKLRVDYPVWAMLVWRVEE